MVNCTKLTSHVAAPLGARKGKVAIPQHSGFQTMPHWVPGIQSGLQAVWWEGMGKGKARLIVLWLTAYFNQNRKMVWKRMSRVWKARATSLWRLDSEVGCWDSNPSSVSYQLEGQSNYFFLSSCRHGWWWCLWVCLHIRKVQLTHFFPSWLFLWLFLWCPGTHFSTDVPEEQRLQAVQAAILLLADESRDVLQTLLCFLKDVANLVEENQMTPKNLAVCLAPSLFHLNLLKKESSPRWVFLSNNRNRKPDITHSSLKNKTNKQKLLTLDFNLRICQLLIYNQKMF